MKNLQEEAKSQNKVIKIIVITFTGICLLLLMLFIASVKLAEPAVMTINLPQTNEKISHTRLDRQNTITILLGENNKIIYYRGALDSPVISPKETKYG